MKNTTPTNKNNNLVISRYGAGIAVGMQGAKDQIEQQFNRFFNLGGAGQGCTTNYCSADKNVGEDYLHWASDNFAYFLSTDEAMEKALVNEKIIALNSQANPELKGKKHGVLEQLTNEAKEEYQQIEREHFMQYKTTDRMALMKLGNTSSDMDYSSMSYADMATLAAYK